MRAAAFTNPDVVPIWRELLRRVATNLALDPDFSVGVSTGSQPHAPHEVRVARVTAQAVTFEVLSGSAIVYGSAVDRTTGTMSLQLPQGISD